MVSPTYRPGVTADAEALTANVVEGFWTFRDFAPDGWEPPPPDEHGSSLAVRLERPDTWCEVAEVDGQIAGHALFIPVTAARMPIADATLGHVVHLFVREPYWGAGIARTLHEHAMSAAARRFTRMRLFTPAGQARARRFYEREGWRLAGASPDDPTLGLEVIEYRRDLAAS